MPILNANLPALPIGGATSNNTSFASPGIKDARSVQNLSTLGNSNANETHSHGHNYLKKVGNEVPPPLPPHRTGPAPQPPAQPNPNAPPVPQRHSSMRNSQSNLTAGTTVVYQSQNSHSTQQLNHAGQIRTIAQTIDIEAKFSHLFHNVTEFPPPAPFTNLPKSYPSLKPRG